MQAAIKFLKERQIDKIVMTRPAVGVEGERHGFLPGDLNKKMEPWTRPIFDVFAEYYYAKEIQNMLIEGVVEVSPLAYMRGMNIDNSILIFEEAQNSTPNQMKLLLMN